ncbi:MAG: hypothetical protein GVY30_00090 [Chloroflexi bacterium]|nr:hypothetical protein [Chloroflexota bacterium]
MKRRWWPHLKNKRREPPQTQAEARRREAKLNTDAYRRYLRSPRWHVKRLRVLIRDGGRCQMCGRYGRDVHHLTYKRIFREPLFDLVTLCRECHTTLHGK